MEALQTTQDLGGSQRFLYFRRWDDTVTIPTLPNRIAWPRPTDTGENRSLSSEGFDYECPETSAGTSNAASLPLSLLERYAELDDRQLFCTIASSIDWSCHVPEELVRAVGLALNLNQVSLAMDMARRGSRLFPEHARIQNLARALAPPTLRAAPVVYSQGLNASRRWIHEHAEEHRGKWIAVRDGELIGVAERLKDMSQVLENPETTVVIRVV